MDEKTPTVIEVRMIIGMATLTTTVMTDDDEPFIARMTRATTETNDSIIIVKMTAFFVESNSRLLKRYTRPEKSPAMTGPIAAAITLELTIDIR